MNYKPKARSSDLVVQESGDETLVYDLEQNVLLWAGTSETTNPGNREAFISELVRAASYEMRKAGVVAR